MGYPRELSALYFFYASPPSLDLCAQPRALLNSGENFEKKQSRYMKDSNTPRDLVKKENGFHFLSNETAIKNICPRPCSPTGFHAGSMP
jgi:hypothetical protein